MACFSRCLMFWFISALWHADCEAQRQTAGLGILQTKTNDESVFNRYCISFLPRLYNLTDEEQSHNYLPIYNATGWDGCSKHPPYSSKALLMLQMSGNCSLEERITNIMYSQGAGAIFIWNSSHSKYFVNDTSPLFPLTFIYQSPMINFTSIEAIQYSTGEVDLFNYGLIFIWMIASLTILLGSIWSATVKYELWMEQQSLTEGSSTQQLRISDTATSREQMSTPMTAISAFAAIIFIISFLLLSYFFPAVMYYVVLVLFFMGSVSGMYTCLMAIVLRKSCCFQSFMLFKVFSIQFLFWELILFCISFSLGVTWLVCRDADPIGWILQDILGVAFALSLIRSCRLPNLYVITCFSCGLLIYDIFFVFITPLFTSNGQSIMVEVATGGGKNILPMVMKIPYLVQTDFPECHQADGFSLLGYGDIIVPGFIAAFGAGFDKINGISSHVYLTVTACGYSIGMMVTFVALYYMDSAQPALLYLVPTTLLPLMLTALIRKEFRLMWKGINKFDSDSVPSQTSVAYDQLTPQSQTQ